MLLVFRRLAEELNVQSSSLTANRRREMSSALRQQIGAVFQFLMQNIEVNNSCHCPKNNIIALFIASKPICFNTYTHTYT